MDINIIKRYGFIALALIISMIALILSLMSEEPVTPSFRVNDGLLQVRKNDKWQSVFDLAELESEDGVSVEGVVLTEDGSLQFELSDGTTLLTDTLDIPQGERGLQGLIGETGNGIEGASLNEIGELVIEYTNGDFQNVGSVMGLRGPRGDAGQDGEDGVNSRFQFVRDLEESYQFLDLAYEIDDQTSYVNEKISAGYIPVASSEDLSAIASSSNHTFASGTAFEITITPNLDDNYIQVAAFNITDAYFDARITDFEGIYDGANYTLGIIRDSDSIAFDPYVFSNPRNARFDNLNLDISLLNVTFINDNNGDVASDFGLVKGPRKGITFVNNQLNITIETDSLFIFANLGLITSGAGSQNENLVYAENISSSIHIDAPNSMRINQLGSLSGRISGNTVLAKNIFSDIYINASSVNEVAGVVGYLQDSMSIIDTISVNIEINAQTSSTHGYSSVTNVGGIVSELNDSGYLIAKNGYTNILVNASINVGDAPYGDNTRMNYIGGVLSQLDNDSTVYIKDITTNVRVSTDVMTESTVLEVHDINFDELSGLIAYIDRDRHNVFIERVYASLNLTANLKDVPLHTINLNVRDSGSIIGLSDGESVNVTLVDSYGEFDINFDLSRPSGTTNEEYDQIGSVFGEAFSSAIMVENSYGYSNYPEITNVIPGRLNVLKGLSSLDDSFQNSNSNFNLRAIWLDSGLWTFEPSIPVPLEVYDAFPMD